MPRWSMTITCGLLMENQLSVCIGQLDVACAGLGLAVRVGGRLVLSLVHMAPDCVAQT